MMTAAGGANGGSAGARRPHAARGMDRRLRPISLRGVASQSVGGLLEERVRVSVVLVGKRLDPACLSSGECSGLEGGEQGSV